MCPPIAAVGRVSRGARARHVPIRGTGRPRDRVRHIAVGGAERPIGGAGTLRVAVGGAERPAVLALVCPPFDARPAQAPGATSRTGGSERQVRVSGAAGRRTLGSSRRRGVALRGIEAGRSPVRVGGVGSVRRELGGGRLRRSRTFHSCEYGVVWREDPLERSKSRRTIHIVSTAVGGSQCAILTVFDWRVAELVPRGVGW